MLSLRQPGEPRVQTMPVRTLVVDDESLSRDRLRALLERDDRVEIVGECTNGVEALRAIEDESPDLVFLDVEMPELSGLAMLEALAPERCPQVVFVTAYDKYLQRAFEVHALDYLRKPYTDERFYDALDHACRRVEERLGHLTTHGAVLAMVAELRERSLRESDRVVIEGKERGVFRVVRTRDIESIVAKDGGVLIHTGRETHRSRQTFAEVEASLEPGLFLRVQRSQLVNRSRIEKIEWLCRGEYVLVLASGKRIPTGRTYRAVIEAFLNRR